MLDLVTPETIFGAPYPFKQRYNQVRGESTIYLLQRNILRYFPKQVINLECMINLNGNLMQVHDSHSFFVYDL